MRNKIKKIIRIGRELISSLLFPKRCPVCDEILSPEETDKGIHLACENKFYPVEGAVCMHCGRPLGQRNSAKEKETQVRFNKQIENERYDDGFDFGKTLPSHLTMESTYEYCMECRRKKYVVNDIEGKYGLRRSRNIQHYRETSYITQAKSLYLYRGAIKNTMYRLKYANKRDYAAFFAQKAMERYQEWFPRFDVIIPVPMYLPKQKQRGYNQAETFAAELSYLTGIPVDSKCIKRVKDTTPQKNLNDIERKNNLENAFQITKSIVQYNCVLIVDDIYTTGYTVEAVAKEFRKHGKCRIYVLSICIGAVN